MEVKLCYHNKKLGFDTYLAVCS